MWLNNKGMYLYEVLISFILLTLIITSFFTFMMTIKVKRFELYETYQMKQTLIANLILLENDQPLLTSDTYTIVYDEQFICIRYINRNFKDCELCLNYEK